jgi:hypothetical protein
LTSVDRGLALLLLFETPLLLPGFLFLRCGSFVWLVGMSSQSIKRALGSVVQPVFQRILNFFFFAKIECGLYFLDRFNVLISKMIFKK